MLASSPAAGQRTYPKCYDSEYLESVLLNKYGEQQVAGGVTTGGWLVERWESGTGTWTLTARSPKREVLCMLGAGDGWRLIEPKPEGTAL